MHVSDILDRIEIAQPKLNFKTNRISIKEIQVTNFSDVYNSVLLLNEIDVLRKYTLPYLEEGTVKGNSSASTISIISDVYEHLSELLNDIKKATSMLRVIVAVEEDYPENSLLIKIPEVKSFEDLTKVANELKIAIDVPVHSIKEDIVIEKVEEGSIWFVITSSVAGLTLLGGLTKAAYAVAKIHAQLRWHAEQSRTIGIKNDLMESILDAQKSFIKNTLNENVKSIFGTDVENEQFERFKASVEIMANLIEKGAEIKPGRISDLEVKNSFPASQEMVAVSDILRRLINNS